jgi:hypothetical protein
VRRVVEMKESEGEERGMKVRESTVVEDLAAYEHRELAI